MNLCHKIVDTPYILRNNFFGGREGEKLAKMFEYNHEFSTTKDASFKATMKSW